MQAVKPRQWRNSAAQFGVLAKLLHWTSAAAFIAAYIIVYYILWFMDEESPDVLPVLNVHWALGLLVGTLVLPRLLWRLFDVQPDPPAGSKLEHALARVAHWALYGLLIILPLTGYLGTGADTDFGLFSVTGFNETAVFGWISASTGWSFETFEGPIDVVHHFVGKWIAWVVVGLHVLAALFHHWVRRDATLVRMLP